MEFGAGLLQVPDPRFGFLLKEINIRLGGVDLGSFQLNELADRTAVNGVTPVATSINMAKENRARLRLTMEDSFW